MLTLARVGKSSHIFTFAVAAAAFVALLVLPIYAGESVSYRDGVEVARSTSHSTLLQVNGASALGPLLVPLSFAALPLLFPRHAGVRVTAAVVLWGFVAVGAASVGLFFLPAAAFALVSVFTRE